ncbi:MAG: hypothetical protein AABW48_05235 [Nanoarchaeota archaeon]|mgnify:CR=1 FL=1
MNKKGGLAMGILIILIFIVATSALILFLVKSGVISVKEDTSSEPVLNAEFLPLGRSGYLAIKDFKFCNSVNENYACLIPKSGFIPGEEVHFLFVIESSTYNGEIMLLENYRIKDPAGQIILDVDQKDSFQFGVKSGEKQELVALKDYFLTSIDAPVGEYTLELIVKNPLLDKQITLVKSFTEE